MTSQTTTIYTPFADGRPVRDIVEHTPALVDETWCRNLLRHVLDSLEQQYASGGPHRPITPDTLVMLANGEALLMPASDAAPASTPDLPADLHALALVVHYAITAELPPDGPLGPRLYDNYSEQLTKGLDSCLGPNRRLRPATVADMRALLGIPAPDELVLPAHTDEVQQSGQSVPLAPVTIVEPPPVLDAGLAGDGVQDAAPAATEDALRSDAPPADALADPAPVDNPLPEPLASAQPDTDTDTATQAEAPAPEPVTLREKTEAGMLRKPASPDSTHAGERIVPPAPPLHDSADAHRTAPHRPSAAIPAPPPGPARGGAGQTRPATGGNSRVQRWGMIAGAAIVVLAAGSALVSYLNQNDTRDLVPLSLPPEERAATGLDQGETVVVPPSAATGADQPLTDQPAGAQPADSPLDATTGAAPDAIPGAVLPSPQAAAGATGSMGGAVVNGTTYKLLIKPWGTVYVDGIDRGVSPPIKRLTLGPGRHTIRITNPSFPEHTMTVDAGARETAVIEHDFTAQAQ